MTKDIKTRQSYNSISKKLKKVSISNFYNGLCIKGGKLLITSVKLTFRGEDEAK